MNHTPPTKKSTPPLFIVAAVVLILFCGVGIAAMLGWLPNIANQGRPELITPPAEPVATAPVAPGTTATQSSQYVAGAGTIDGAPAKGKIVSSGASVGGSSGNSGAIDATANDNRASTSSRDDALQRERERERARERAERKRVAAVCNNCGIVESINEIKTRASGSGVGAGAGAVVGGLLGRQVGDGRGRDLATIAGAVGGAVVGNQVEGNIKGKTGYDVSVRMHDGEIRTVHTDAPKWRPGDQVKIVDGELRAR